MSNETPTPAMQYCTECGTQYSTKAQACPKCGAPSAANRGYPRNRAVYVFFALFWGNLGAHNFYSGHTGKGWMKIILDLCIVGFIINPIIALIEAFTVTKDVNGIRFQ